MVAFCWIRSLFWLEEYLMFLLPVFCIGYLETSIPYTSLTVKYMVMQIYNYTKDVQKNHLHWYYTTKGCKHFFPMDLANMDLWHLHEFMLDGSTCMHDTAIKKSIYLLIHIKLSPWLGKREKTISTSKLHIHSERNWICWYDPFSWELTAAS